MKYLEWQPALPICASETSNHVYCTERSNQISSGSQLDLFAPKMSSRVYFTERSSQMSKASSTTCPRQTSTPRLFAGTKHCAEQIRAFGVSVASIELQWLTNRTSCYPDLDATGSLCLGYHDCHVADTLPSCTQNSSSEGRTAATSRADSSQGRQEHVDC